jgi:hypothetical protein
MLDWFVRLNRKTIDMHEFTLLETGYLAGLLPLSLVLPLITSFRDPLDATTKRFCMRTVWTGQTLLALTGLTVLVSPLFAPYFAAFGLMDCVACSFVLHRTLRAKRQA